MEEKMGEAEDQLRGQGAKQILYMNVGCLQ